MASTNGQDSHSVISELLEHPWDYDFFQALRLLECAAPELPRIGTSSSVKQDFIRFGQFLSLGFATETINGFDDGKKSVNHRKLLIRFTGLTGPNGPLPLRMTEYIRSRKMGMIDPDTVYPTYATNTGAVESSSKDSTMADFLDVFHHRIISLFYRAWAVAQKTVDLDRPDEQRFSDWVGSTFGIGSPALREDDTFQSWARLAFAGHLSCQTRHAEGLKSILSVYFSTKVSIESFVGHWMELPKDDRYRMGIGGRLGESITVGSKVWDCQLMFRLEIGPVNFEQFQRFLPGGIAYQRLCRWIDFYTHRQYFWDAVIILRKEEVPAVQMGRAGSLGRSGWLLSGPMKQDARDYVIRETDRLI